MTLGASVCSVSSSVASALGVASLGSSTSLDDFEENSHNSLSEGIFAHVS
jgi:hypothetical protein